MSVSQSAFGRSTVKLRLTRSSSVAWLTRFFLRFFGPGNPLDLQLAHDRQDQLLVDDHVLLALESGSDPQHPIGAPRSRMDVGHQAHQQESTDLTVGGHVELVLVKARS